MIEHYAHSTTSNWLIDQSGHMINSSSFSRLDYGHISERNWHLYADAPDYLLDKLPVKNISIVIFHSNTDSWLVPDDANKLINQLEAYCSNSKMKLQDVLVEAEQWNHVDYVIGIGANEFVFQKTIEILDSNYNYK